MQDCQLVAERNDLELEFRAAAKPATSHERSSELNASMAVTLRPDKINR
jgi:hypothetical protein